MAGERTHQAAAPSGRDAPCVGVLALQGDFADHEAALARACVRTRRVRRATDLHDLDGLVLPGGESTTMLKLLDVEGLWEPLGAVVRSGLPVLATCAGLILLAAEVVDPSQRSYGVLDVTVQRNGYGRQLHSGTFVLQGDGVPAGTEGVFIRAPRILRCGPAVEVLARRGDDPVLVRQGSILAAAFHPEMQDDHLVIRSFVDAVQGARRVPS